MDWKKEFKELMFSDSSTLDDIDKAFVVKQNNMPKALYKYRSFDKEGWSLKNLENDTVWLSLPEDFNDPYDCSFCINIDGLVSGKNQVQYLVDELGFDISPDVITKINLLPDPLDAFLNLFLEGESNKEEKVEVIKNLIAKRDLMLKEKFNKTLKSTSKVTCFSENHLSILMWSHYADYHKGFCIEYDMSKQSEKDLFSRLTYPVIYGDELYDATSTIKKINDGKAFLGMQLPTLMKSSEWKYEREWRLIAPFNIMAANNTFKTPVPIRVYLGARIDSNDEIKIRNICDRKGIKVVKVRISPDEFRLTEHHS
ncbi:DUF2971 domain-containing protein [Aliivibrio fischeri]|uniref:DUF2971 domain-containing protein n=1 Tax=Aliivibrio fischeri TaxID=668 RepID=A0A844P680_ALIFS|nr:DUF2971 domain-containing protein [Aliivibrio fischeri]MUK31923.1 DUF2971 domain-containing protein [Aliivibrio fischeri]MUK51522.1 DUF2971 domain-containing protein [Aliivibrio fischeri]MUK67337.1 DUF2971 domain-containing protein [Aliivibrio fischeri]